MSFMPILASRMAVEECPWWSEMCLTAKSSSRRACRWCRLCLQCWCHPRSSHQRWKLGEESRLEPLSVAVRQEKLLEKLNLDGLAHWSPENAVAVRELVLAYHDVFTLESNELGCTSAIEHEIRIKNDEPFKERFWRIPPTSPGGGTHLSGICWRQGRFIQANPHGATRLSWSGRRMVHCISA